MLIDVAVNAFDKIAFSVEPVANSMLQHYIHDMWLNRDKHFGNARVIRQFAESVIINHANRIMTTTQTDDFTISESDIRNSLSRLQIKSPARSRIGFV